jgi:hypothetical protein
METSYKIEPGVTDYGTFKYVKALDIKQPKLNNGSTPSIAADASRIKSILGRPKKRASEIEAFAVDFSSRLTAGEVILEAVWTISVYSGADPDAAAMICGEAEIAGPQVCQLIGGGRSDATYAPICTATTNIRVLVLPEPGDGILHIKG